MSLGEILALKTTDVDLKSNKIHVIRILNHDKNHKSYIHKSSLSQTENSAMLIQINDVNCIQ